MQSQSSENVSHLAHRLNSKDEPTRQQAQDELRVLIAADVRRIRRIQTVLRVEGIVYSLLFTPAFVYGLVMGHQGIGDYIVPMTIVSFGTAFLLTRLQRRATRGIIALDIPQAVGPLIDVLATSSVFPGSETKAALTRLLPRLKSSDANLLLPRQRKSLNLFLRIDESWRNSNGFYGADLKIAILHALEQIGDQTALPAVEKLAKSARDPAVR